MDKRYIYVGIFVCVLFLTMALITVLLLLTFLWNNNVTNGSKLVIDHDGGADDAMAISIALIHEKYFDGPQVVALTTTFGNVDESQAFINSQKILHLANRRDVPIYRGSKTPFIEGIETDYYYGSDGLGLCDTDYEPIQPQPEHAVQALIELSKEYEGNLTIVAIGSTTNIALAIKIDPEFLSRLSTLYVGAGYIHNPTFPEPEFNAAMDPEAYYIIGKAATPNQVTIVPFTQVHEYMNNTKEWRQSTLGALQTDTMDSLNCFERISMENSTDWSQLDPAVMALALNNSLVEEFRYAKNSIVLCGMALHTNYAEYVKVTVELRVGTIKVEYLANVRPKRHLSITCDNFTFSNCSRLPIFGGEVRGVGICESHGRFHSVRDKRSVNTNDFLPESEANVRVIYSGNREKYQEFLLSTFSAELSDT